MQCSIHKCEAVGACTGCGRGICRECAVSVQGRLLCRACIEKTAIDQNNVNKELKLKDPASAAAMSMLHGGLGQIYNGEIGKGLTIIGAKVLLLLISIIAAVHGAWLIAMPLFLFGWGGLWAFGIYDAYQSASRYNRQQLEPGARAKEYSTGHY